MTAAVSSVDAGSPTAGHEAFVEIAMELAVLVASVVIAGTDGGGRVMLAVWVTLAVLWAVHHYSQT